MTLVSRNTLKSFFIPGAKPTSAQFHVLIDSALILPADQNLLGLKNYNPALSYIAGDSVIYNQIIYQAAANTSPGAFNINSWNKIAGSTPGSVNYKGTWDAEDNDPALQSITPGTGDYYVVSVAGSTPMNTPPNIISDWQVGDWAIYNGVLWEKIDNTESVTDAINVGAGAEIYKGKNNTVLEFNSITANDGSALITSNTDSIDIGVQFNDDGVSASRAWSAYKINSELTLKEAADPNIQAHIADVVNNPHQVTKAQVGLGNVPDTKINFEAISDPAINNDNTQGYSIGSTWINTVAQTQFLCMDASTGNAVWQKLTANPNIQAHISNLSNPHGTTKSQVGLGNVQNIKVNFSAITNPLPADDSNHGYATGSTWINTANAKEFVCVNAEAGAATWKETTVPINVFGSDYLFIESAVVSATTSTSFQPYPVPADVFRLSTGTRNGTYRLQWSCTASNNRKPGEFRLVDYTNPLLPVQIGQSFLIECASDLESVPLGSIANVVLSGTNRDYVIQFRALGGASTEIIKGARFEIFRIS